MTFNLIQLLQSLLLLLVLMGVFGGGGYYIDRANPVVAKKSAFISAGLAIIPIFAIAFLCYLYVTANKRLSI